MDTFLLASTSCRIWNVYLVLDDQQIQILPVATFLVISGSCMKILFIVKVKIL